MRVSSGDLYTVTNVFRHNESADHRMAFDSRLERGIEHAGMDG